MKKHLNEIINPIQRFYLKIVEASGLLFFASIVAIVVANSQYSEMYKNLLEFPVVLKIGEFNLFNHHGGEMNLQTFVNDALMTVFFFMIGLEIKREVLVGELSSFKKAMLPVIAAIGGMIIPVLIFHFIAPNSPESKGAAIPMATDIAFALGVLSILGNRIPLGLKIFLTALAVVDDIGGILVIAIFYSGHVLWAPLFIAATLILIVYIAGRLGVRTRIFYYFMLYMIWRQLLESGIHATIAGVVTAMAVPALPRVQLNNFVKSMKRYINYLHADTETESAKRASILTDRQVSVLKHIESATDRSISTLQAIADDLHNIANYVILPLFVFTNAGIVFVGMGGDLVSSISIGVALALFIGKPLGIFGFTYIGVKMKFVDMPRGANFRKVFAVSILGGMGFTVALFIANLSYTSAMENGTILLNQAKVGIVLGSILSGFASYGLLRYFLRSSKRSSI